MTSSSETETPTRKVVEEISEEEAQRIINTAKNDKALLSRVFLFGMSMFGLLIVMYILLITYPNQAAWIGLSILVLMCICLLYYVWNEMTHHHHIKEKYNYEYHQTPSIIISNNNEETSI